MARDISFDEIEFAGAMAVRFLDVDVTSYDSTNGESFTPQDAGMSRMQLVLPMEVGGDGYNAVYSESEDAIRIMDGGSELADAGTATLRVVVFGRT